MKASLEHLSENINQPIQLKEIVQARFDAPYHFHPELELTLIISGEGKRFIGNQISDFSPGDLVLLGSNLPHCWQNHRNDWLGSDETSDAAQAIVIHFKRDFLGDKFWYLERHFVLTKRFLQSQSLPPQGFLRLES